ncbi:hypothetical protein NNX28_08405 [Arthrobacter sp. zg-Y859]|uniref:Uncharacterized protein n=1 Tax=Arthrobacter jinronghuae TaxID=2964609 RepID=A0ABT1NQD1_9MICC|nr:hypothetical protein [Arthrobacter jinronghuae]MCQ1949945.1 hypothetical protein [Arthrobacter jinronghuae]UWX80092.1 hypothetical protein N2K98_07895 [Arthrobacter jinronghuae]
MAGSLASGALAAIDVALPVAAGGAVFGACTGLALRLDRSDDEMPAEAASLVPRTG